MENLQPGVEYPADLFASLKKNMDIKKGALLLPENETGAFVPWSAAGFDRTTRRRMRIAPGLIYAALKVTESTTILTNLDELEDLLPCFSSREAALTESVFLCLFTAEDKITAVLLVTDSPYLFLDEGILRLFFTVIARLASPRLAKTRREDLHAKSGRGYIRKDSFHASLKSFAGELPQNSALTFFTFDAKTLIAAIRESRLDIDEYRVLEDITAAIGTLLADAPVFVSVKKKKILAATRSGQFDSALLAHQVSRTIGKLFHCEETPDLDIAENSLPAGSLPDDAVGKFL